METAARLLDEILDGVRTPERARSPVDAYITVRTKGGGGGGWRGGVVALKRNESPY